MSEESLPSYDKHSRRRKVFMGLAIVLALIVAGTISAWAAGWFSDPDPFAAEFFRLVQARVDLDGTTALEPFAPTWITRAKSVKTNASAADRAAAAVMRGDGREARAVIASRRSRGDVGGDERYALALIEAFSWIQTNDPDQALESCEEALSLRALDGFVRDLTMQLCLVARKGDVDARQKRGAELAEENVRAASPKSEAWAQAKANSVLPLLHALRRDPQKDVAKIVLVCESIVSELDRSRFPEAWASAQFNLFGALYYSPRKDPDRTRKMIAVSDAVMTVYTKTSHPALWAQQQYLQASLYSISPIGDDLENQARANGACQAALSVFTPEAYPVWWAKTQILLADVWAMSSIRNSKENLPKAVDAYGAALTIYTKESYPQEWAQTQAKIGSIWKWCKYERPGVARDRALSAYRAALTVYTRDAFPMAWAKTQRNIAETFYIQGDDRDNDKRLAIEALALCLTVFTPESSPREWASAQELSGNLWSNLSDGQPTENFKRSLESYEAAMRVYTKEAYPSNWAGIHNSLASLWQFAETGDRDENRKKAIAECEKALTALSKESDGVAWARAHESMGYAWMHLRAGDRQANYEKAIEAYENALKARSKSTDAGRWADDMRYLGAALGQSSVKRDSERYRKSMAAFQEALQAEISLKNERAWKQTRLAMSWIQLLAGDAQAALVTTEPWPEDTGVGASLEVNRTHALLFLGRVPEALESYGKIAKAPGRAKVLLDDFREFEERGITRPEFAQVRDLLDHEEHAASQPSR